MREILIITSYYPPEIGAASNRIFQLAQGLKKTGYEVSVTTPLPNYPTGKIFEEYKGHFSLKTNENSIRVNRLWVFASNSKNKVHRLLSMFSYSFSLLWFFITHKIPQTVIVQSPPLFVAFTCMLFLRRKSRNLVLNVSDLWPMAGKELGVLKEGFSYSILEKIERFNYKKADIILGQSEEILTHIKAIFPDKDTFLYRNYPDFVAPKSISPKSNENKKVKLVYAGLLGIAQGIYRLMQFLDYDLVELHLYGGGAELEQIQSYIQENPKKSIFYNGQVSRVELHNKLQQYDIVMIPLLNRIYGSVPSKIFEYARLGLPIIYMGGGEGEDIVTHFQLGWVIEVGNYNELNVLLRRIVEEDLQIDRKHIVKVSNTSFNFQKQLSELSGKI